MRGLYHQSEGCKMENASARARQTELGLVDQIDATTTISEEDWKAILEAIAKEEEPSATAHAAAERWGLRPRIS